MGKKPNDLRGAVGRIHRSGVVDDLSDKGREQLKIRVLDSLGCALGAVEGQPVRFVREQVEDFGGTARCTLVGGYRPMGGEAPGRHSRPPGQEGGLGS
jgi:2-methylcitrate dehydratase PrpD